MIALIPILTFSLPIAFGLSPLDDCKAPTGDRTCVDKVAGEQKLNSENLTSSLVQLLCTTSSGSQILYSGVVVGDQSTIATSSDAVAERRSGKPLRDCVVGVIGKDGQPIRGQTIKARVAYVSSHATKDKDSWALFRMEKPLRDTRPAKPTLARKTGEETISVSRNLNGPKRCVTASICKRSVVQMNDNVGTTFLMQCPLIAGDQGGGVFAKSLSNDGELRVIGLASSTFNFKDKCANTFVGLDEEFLRKLEDVTQGSEAPTPQIVPSPAPSPAAQ